VRTRKREIADSLPVRSRRRRVHAESGDCIGDQLVEGSSVAQSSSSVESKVGLITWAQLGRIVSWTSYADQSAIFAIGEQGETERTAQYYRFTGKGFAPWGVPQVWPVVRMNAESATASAPVVFNPNSDIAEIVASPGGVVSFPVRAGPVLSLHTAVEDFDESLWSPDKSTWTVLLGPDESGEPTVEVSRIGYGEKVLVGACLARRCVSPDLSRRQSAAVPSWHRVVAV
jgi:hypothetical protein